MHLPAIPHKQPHKHAVLLAKQTGVLTHALHLQQYWNSSQPYKHISVPAFAEMFKSFKVGRETAARIAEGPDKAALDKQNQGVELLVKKKYALSNGQLFHACWQVRYMFHGCNVAFLSTHTVAWWAAFPSLLAAEFWASVAHWGRRCQCSSAMSVANAANFSLPS